jgi:hypothetical protein
LYLYDRDPGSPRSSLFLFPLPGLLEEDVQMEKGGSRRGALKKKTFESDVYLI